MPKITPLDELTNPPSHQQRIVAYLKEHGHDAEWPADMKFESVVEEERLARQALLSAEQDGASRKQFRELKRAWWSSVSALTAAYSEHGEVAPPLPLALLHTLTTVSGDLGRGIVPDLISGVRGKGRAEAGVRESACIAAAVCYVRAAQNRLVADPHPYTTIQGLFEINDDSTLMRWVRENPQVASTDLGADAVEIRTQLERLGREYREISRTHAAQRTRTARGGAPKAE